MGGRMTDLMKQFEVEMNWSLEQAKKDYKVGIFLHAYIEWLEAQLTEALEVQTVEKFQEIIRIQCDEISTLKAQLTWRPVSEKPEKEGQYFHRFDEDDCEVALYENETWFYWNHDMAEWVPYTSMFGHWLPIPPAQEVKV